MLSEAVSSAIENFTPMQRNWLCASHCSALGIRAATCVSPSKSRSGKAKEHEIELPAPEAEGAIQICCSLIQFCDSSHLLSARTCAGSPRCSNCYRCQVWIPQMAEEGHFFSFKSMIGPSWNARSSIRIGVAPSIWAQLQKSPVYPKSSVFGWFPECFA